VGQVEFLVLSFSFFTKKKLECFLTLVGGIFVEYIQIFIELYLIKQTFCDF